MKRNVSILLIFILPVLCTSQALAVERMVTSANDAGMHSLRQVIEGACRDDGDDVIHFANARGRFVINLQSPVIIPADCVGTVTLMGHNDEVIVFEGNEVIRFDADQEIIINGEAIRNGDGILILRSWNNTLSNFTLVGHGDGAGLVVESGRNHIENLRVGVFRDEAGVLANGSGMIIEGQHNVLESNHVSGNWDNGIEILGQDNELYNNRIGDHDSCSPLALPQEALEDYPAFQRDAIVMENIFFPDGPWMLPPLPNNDWFFFPTACGNGGSGVLLEGSLNVIGESLETANTIRFNRAGGIAVTNGAIRNRFFNILSDNGGPGISLAGAANNRIEAVTNFKAQPLNTEPADGIYRYLLSGQNRPDVRIDLFQSALVSSAADAEGARYITSFDAADEIFSYELSAEQLMPGSYLVALACTDRGDCSEFSAPLYLDRDSDQDCVLDRQEDRNGNRRLSPDDTHPLSDDTDGDGLPDGLEDRNCNGRVDDGETDPKKVDTDADGVSDFVETGGDGTYDVALHDTDPRNEDTDGDGISDGEEDVNGNGILDLGETDPLRRQ
jgi:parallel beta-helix repeat protein